MLRSLAIAVTAACVACSEGDRPPGASEAANAWDTVFVLQAGLEDTSLIAPFQVAAFRDGVAVLEGLNGAPRVTYVDGDGRIRWTFAREGEGPGELQSVVSAVETREGIWVLYRRGARLVLISGEGRYVRQVPLPGLAGPAGLIAAGDGEVLVVGTRILSRRSLVDGAILDERPIPWTRTPPAGWVRILTVTGSVDRAAIGMQYGPEALVLENGQVRAAILNDSVPYEMRVNGPGPGGGPFIPELNSTRIGFFGLGLTDRLWALTGGDPVSRSPTPAHRARPRSLGPNRSSPTRSTVASRVARSCRSRPPRS